jgi:hypothetical protein
VQLCPSLKDVLYRGVLARSDMFLAWHRHNLLFLAFLLETLGNPGITIRALTDVNQSGRERLARRLGLGEQTIFLPHLYPSLVGRQS